MSEDQDIRIRSERYCARKRFFQEDFDGHVVGSWRASYPYSHPSHERVKTSTMIRCRSHRCNKKKVELSRAVTLVVVNELERGQCRRRCYSGYLNFEAARHKYPDIVLPDTTITQQALSPET